MLLIILNLKISFELFKHHRVILFVTEEIVKSTSNDTTQEKLEINSEKFEISCHLSREDLGLMSRKSYSNKLRSTKTEDPG